MFLFPSQGRLVLCARLKHIIIGPSSRIHPSLTTFKDLPNCFTSFFTSRTSLHFSSAPLHFRSTLQLHFTSLPIYASTSLHFTSDLRFSFTSLHFRFDNLKPSYFLPATGVGRQVAGTSRLHPNNRCWEKRQSSHEQTETSSQETDRIIHRGFRR